jgi:hypothetical protein
MRIPRIKLINWVGVYLGQGCQSIEILFGDRRLNVFRAKNGKGKTTVMSQLSPFASSGNLDDRNGVNYILEGKVGRKEIDYEVGKHFYEIIHIYRPVNKTHTVKSYIKKDGKELNENGNVSSFLEYVEKELDIKESDMRLMRLGANVKSFIQLTAQDRKKYMMTLLSDVDKFLETHKKVNANLRTVNGMIRNANDTIGKLGIDDPSSFDNDLKDLKDKIDVKLIKLGSLQSERKSLEKSIPDDIVGLQSEYANIIGDVQFIETASDDIKKSSVVVLRKKKTDHEQSLQLSSQDYYRLLSDIESANKSIALCNIDLQRLASGMNNELSANIFKLEIELKKYNHVSDKVFKISQEDYYNLMQNVVAIYTMADHLKSHNNDAINMAINLFKDKINVDEWANKLLQKCIDISDKDKMKKQVDMLLKNYKFDFCPEQDRCPYYTLHMALNATENPTYNAEVIKDVQYISTVLDEVNNKLHVIPKELLPKELQSELDIDCILYNIGINMIIFNIDKFHMFGRLISDKENYVRIKSQYDQYKQELNRSKSSYDEQINLLKKRISSYETIINDTKISSQTLSEKINVDKSAINNLEVLIGNRLKYESLKSTIHFKKDALKKINNQIELYKTGTTQISDISHQIDALVIDIDRLKLDASDKERRMNTYKKCIADLKEFNEDYEYQSYIVNSTSAKEGMPLEFINSKKRSIQINCNKLLQYAHKNQIQLCQFNIDEDVFEIPLINKGYYVKDAKILSQGELSNLNTALAFSMSSSVMRKYNIPLLDEMDGPLDSTNKKIFFDMMEEHLVMINAEQCFLTSHSPILNTMPINVIDMNVDESDDDQLENAIKCKIIRQ